MKDSDRDDNGQLQLGILSLRLFDMRRKRNFWRWAAGGFMVAFIVMATEVFR
jgi:hypothetical protein